MSIFDKYDVSPEKIKAMVRDGIIPCAVISHDEVLSSYQNFMSKNGGKKTLSMSEAAEKHRVSFRWVAEIVRRYE